IDYNIVFQPGIRAVKDQVDARVQSRAPDLAITWHTLSPLPRIITVEVECWKAEILHRLPLCHWRAAHRPKANRLSFSSRHHDFGIGKEHAQITGAANKSYSLISLTII